MKLLFVLFYLSTFTAYSQTSYFISDTVGLEIDTLNKDTTYFISEIWYLSKSDTINHVLIFDKDFSKHTMKFEFAKSGVCYVEAGWLSCGKYGMDFNLNFKTTENVLSILDPSNSFPENMKGDFTIAEYSSKQMILIGGKNKKQQEIEEILKNLPY